MRERDACGLCLFLAERRGNISGSAVFAGHALHMIATPQQSLEAAAAAARAAGLNAYILSD
ncbi:MAG: hypothetical protein ACK4OG_01770, partial [Parvibaculum sp.]